jgi:hypothetical protein
VVTGHTTLGLRCWSGPCSIRFRVCDITLSAQAIITMENRAAITS